MQEPESATYQEYLTVFYVERGYQVAEKGLSEAERLIELAAENPRSYELLGWAYFQSGDLTQAETALRQSLALQPDQPALLYRLGRVLEAQGRNDEAATLYAQVVDWDTSDIYRERILNRRQPTTE